MSPLSRGKNFWILDMQNSASFTFNWKETNRSSTQRNLSGNGRLCFIDVIYDGSNILTRQMPYKEPSFPGDSFIEVLHRSLWEDIRCCHWQQKEGWDDLNSQPFSVPFSKICKNQSVVHAFFNSGLGYIYNKSTAKSGFVNNF